MPTRRLPNTDVTRQRALNAAKLKNDALAPADRFLTAATQTRLNTIQPLFNNAIIARGSALSSQGADSATEDSTFGNAHMFIDHFIQVFNLGVRRGKYLAAHRALYQLPMNSDSLPTLNSEADITTWGANLVAGDALRITAGGAAMENPTIKEVSDAVAAFNSSSSAQQGTSYAFDTAEEAVAALREEADKVIKKIWDEVETFYNEEKPPSMRRKARQWGVVYVSDVKLTFHLSAKDSVSHSAIAGVDVKLVETDNSITLDDGGDGDMQSIVSDEATFEFSKTGYTKLTKKIDLPAGIVEFTVIVDMVAEGGKPVIN